MNESHSVLMSVPVVELRIVKSRVNKESQPFEAPPTLLNVAVLLFEVYVFPSSHVNELHSYLVSFPAIE
jgi:hypothetical protein